MARKHFYVLVNFTDEVNGIYQIEMTDARCRSIAWKFYLSNIGFKFLIEMFRYRRCGSKAYWVFILRIPRGTSNSSDDFIKNISAASREAPEHLSRRKTSYSIASIWSTVG